MSVQFGTWSFDGRPLAQHFLDNVSETLAPYGPDSNQSYSEPGLTVLFRAFYTTEESPRETQPHISPSGAVITWDGRLDNRAELIDQLGDISPAIHTDIEIVAAAWDRYGTHCFAKLIGDWALSVWNRHDRSLILAKDSIGIRHLYYALDDNRISWATILDPLVRFAGKSFKINEEYVAGWLSYFPAVHTTPYVGIHSVPPASFVRLQNGSRTVIKYWDFEAGKVIRYAKDAEYEEHFRDVFSTAVQRRLRSDRPVLAELSGGLDSSAIVCIADRLAERAAADTQRVDTISWYDDSYDHIEPDTNESRFFTKVEQQRGRSGFHINFRDLRANNFSNSISAYDFDNDCFAPTPSCNKKLSPLFHRYAMHMSSGGYRVTLSGIGGDEVTCGGVPTPTPELQDLLAQAQFRALVQQLNSWAVKMKKPRSLLLWQVLRNFISPRLTGVSIDMRPVPWLRARFVRRNFAALCGYATRVKLLGPLPSFQENVAALDVIRRLLASWPLYPDMVREVRFPYLDRDLLEYLFSVPRTQLVGVGKRRFLMKRALVGIIPDEVLQRRQKAFVAEEQRRDGPIKPPRCIGQKEHFISSSLDIVDPTVFWEAMQKPRWEKDVQRRLLNETITLELWLRHVDAHGYLNRSVSPSTRVVGQCQEKRDPPFTVSPNSAS